jgi:hypothetical protein
MKIITKEEFVKVLNAVNAPKYTNQDYIYEIYEISSEAIQELIDQNVLGSVQPINPVSLICYILGEYSYSVSKKDDETRIKFEQNEEIKFQMAGVVADKYLSDSHFNFKEKRISSKFMPPMSSLDLYLNFMLNMLNTYPKNEPSSTIIVDLLIKSVSIARCVIELLESGYETEAMSAWRTLHECECTLLILRKYGEPLIQEYIKHMNYGIAFKIGKNNREETEAIFEKIKNEMHQYGLKSKDTKKYIEYGWLYHTNEIPLEELKLNFRDGLETIAGLHNYAEIYEKSSEIVHSTPVLIYSNKLYYYFLALINTYESFFRIEKIFTDMFYKRVSPTQQKQYQEMQKVYYSQLMTIHHNELENFKNLKIKK